MKKRIIALGMAVLAAVSLSACTTTVNITSSVAEANPWEDVDSLKDAEESMGFSVTEPDMSEYGSNEVYRVCAALSEIEIQYLDGDDQKAYIRKASETGDISGDYNEYDYEESADIGDKTGVTLKGESEDKINLATWETVEGYSYCIGITDGVSVDTMSSLVEAFE